jgi:hypothetical protein
LLDLGASDDEDGDEGQEDGSEDDEDDDLGIMDDEFGESADDPFKMILPVSSEAYTQTQWHGLLEPVDLLGICTL